MVGVAECAAEALGGKGFSVGVVNARFVKPLDEQLLLELADLEIPVVTVEENALAGGFGSAVLEAVNEARLDASRIRRLGIPNQYTEHGTREELLAELGLDVAGIADACCKLNSDAVAVARLQS